MEYSQIEAFVEVARHRSFSRAAEALFVTQPTITSRIQSLEREMACQLFERRSRGVYLTDDGDSFLPYAERSLQALTTGRDLLERMRSAAEGRLQIGAARTIGTYVLPGILRTFQERHPGIEVTIRTGRSSDVQQMLLDDDVQLGLTRSLVHPDLAGVHLYDEELLLVAHPKHRFASVGAVTMYDIGREPLILYDPGSAYYILINQACQAAGIVPSVTMQLDSIEATKKMIEYDLGVSLLPQSAVSGEIERGTLAMVPITGDTPVQLPTSVLYRHHRPLSGVVNAFLDLLASIYDPASA